MSIEPSPKPNHSQAQTLIEQLAGREFSFYPSIGNLETNLWKLLEANWSELLVENLESKVQVWVPRRYLGEVSAADRPVVIVGLNKALDYKAGQVWQVHKRVLEMPRIPVGPAGLEHAPASNLPTPSLIASGLRLDASEKKVGRLIFVALAVSLVFVALVVFFFRGFESGDMVSYKAVVQESLGLGPEDDYYAVVRKLGTPQEDRWKAEGESLQYRVLHYPNRNLNIILAGRERKQALYAGALDGEWKVVDSVNQKGGSNTYRVLSKLPKF